MSALACNAERDCRTRTTSENCTASESWTRTKYCYDNSGNLLFAGTCPTAPNPNSYFYDAENQLIQVGGTFSTCSTATACYVYDANGRRVRKTTASGGSVDFLYDLSGNVITEVSSTGSFDRGEIYAGGHHLATYNLGTTFFNHSDWLGTERARTTPTGTLYETCASLPFGDSLGCSAADASPLHFTGKERDSESGLDNFTARYFGSSLGRFMSTDPVGGHLDDPQTLNKYVYVRDNPLRFTDPTGLDLKEQCAQESATCHKQHWFSRHRYVGTYNQQNHFEITHFQTDQSGNLAGHTVNFDSTGPHIDGNRAEFIAGTPATRVNGAGAFDGMHAVFNSNCEGTCAAGGLLFGTQAQFQNLVKNLVGPNPGLDAIDFFHPGTIQFRGGNTNGPDAHLSFNESNDPYQRDPFHFDNRYPYGSAGGFLEHTGGVIQTFWNSLTGQHGPPLPQDITPSVSVPQ